MSSCERNNQSELRGLRERIRSLEDALFKFQASATCDGGSQSCQVCFITPGISHDTGTLTVTWASVPGMQFVLESSPDGVDWTILTPNLPAGPGTITTFTTGLAEGAPMVYFRVREGPISCCPDDVGDAYTSYRCNLYFSPEATPYYPPT